jgi:hypothetical protein
LLDDHFHERVIRSNDVFLSWDASSTVYDMSEESLRFKLAAIRSSWITHIRKARFIFITFGTSWGYRLAENGVLVGNCHKFPNAQFQRELTTQVSIVKEWKETIDILRKVNPSLRVVFTVSPVRHSREGLIENNQSKAILIDAVRQLVETSECSYFPSYEILLDVLRDYRFYNTDRVHPTAEAIEFIWNQFSKTFIDEETLEFNRQVRKYKLFTQHRPKFQESESFQMHQKNAEKLKNELLKKYPFLDDNM